MSLSPQQALSLVNDHNFLELGQQANEYSKKLNGNRVAYMVDCNINYSNTCTCGCRFCAFYRPPGHVEAFTLTSDEMAHKIDRAISLGAKRVLLQGGMDPEKKIDYFEKLFRHIKSQHAVQLHALSPTEIDFVARISNISIRETLTRLIAAGLNSIPGGGAEILVDKIRHQVSPNKCQVDTWINVMREAHRLGLKTTATMMFGHVESWEDRIEHLDRIRTLQDETNGFLSFIPWTFQPGNSPLSHEPGVHLITAHNYLKLVAIARLFLDNIPHIQASTLTQGIGVSQVALLFGCDDIGSVMVEENVIASTSTLTHFNTSTLLKQAIEQSGHLAYQRDTYYQEIL